MVIICNEATLWFARPRKALCLYVRGWQVITNGENGTRAFKEQSGVQDLPSVSQHFSSYAEVYCLPCVSLYREWTFFWDWSNAGSFPDEEETHFSKWNSCIMAETLIKIELLYLKKDKVYVLQTVKKFLWTFVSLVPSHMKHIKYWEHLS